MSENDFNPLNLNRRQILAMAAALSGGALLPTQPAAATDMADEMPGHPKIRENPLKLKVGMLVYPRMVLLDLLGPLTAMNILRAESQLIWKAKESVSTDVGIPVLPTTTFEECHETFDLLFVPGGLMGTIPLMQDSTTLDFLADKGSKARYVSSVCTGSLILAAAGLLNGYDATSHWGVADLLPIMGARQVNKRVVEDRNRITGGGVTAGLDLALKVAARLYGEEEARRVQLIMEYSPEPPFKNGTPEEAGADRLATARSRRVWMDGQAKAAAEAAAARLGFR